MKKFILVFLIGFSVMPPQKGHAQAQVPVDVVLTIDLSGSTNGIILDLRNQFFTILSELQSYRPMPNLRIGLVAYARPSYGRDYAYVKIYSDLTKDFDSLADIMFQIRVDVEKGDQYVGSAINVCNRYLSWNNDPNAVRVMFLVGNGEVDLSNYDYKKACLESVAKGIILNSVYIKSTSKNKKEFWSWMNIAELGNGKYYEVQINKPPFPLTIGEDYNKLIELNKRLNRTYLPFGTKGKEKMRMLIEIDNIIAGVNDAALESRVYYKTTKNFRQACADWDLVDNSYRDFLEPSNFPIETRPDTLKGLNDIAFKTYVYGQRLERTRAIREIQEFLGGLDRQQKLNAKRAEMELKEDSILSRVIAESLKEILEAKGIRIPEL